MVAELKAPVELTDAELDAVTGGQLVEVDVSRIANNSLNNNDVTVGVPVNASVNAAVLGTAVNGPTTQRGRIT